VKRLPLTVNGKVKRNPDYPLLPFITLNNPCLKKGPLTLILSPLKRGEGRVRGRVSETLAPEVCSEGGIMGRFFIFSIPLVLLANPIKIEIINEFQTDYNQRLEFHLTDSIEYPILYDSVITPVGVAIIDTNLVIEPGGYLIIDTSMLSGPFYLPQDSGFIIYPNFLDTVFYPYDGYYYIVPAPPIGSSAAKFYCWINSGVDLEMLKDWYIDSTPTFGYPNDDYQGCKISGYVCGNGTPLNGAEVIARTYRNIYTPHSFYDSCITYTDQDGFYFMDSLLPDRFWVEVAYPGYLPDSQLTDPLHFLQPLTINFNLVGIEDNKVVKDPASAGLKVYPNPFQGLLRISYIVGRNAKNYALRVYDASGRLVKDFSRFTTYDLRPTGIIWDGTDDMGCPVQEGVYFICTPYSRVKVIKL